MKGKKTNKQTKTNKNTTEIQPYMTISCGFLTDCVFCALDRYVLGQGDWLNKSSGTK